MTDADDLTFLDPPPAVACVACGDTHADPETATRIGISYVAADCAWTLRYPGMNAAEVIAQLEGRLGIHAPPVHAPPRPVDRVLDDDATQEMEVVDDDPAARVEQNQFVESVLCSVCEGDGELVGSDGEHDGAVMCARCNGSGRVSVVGTGQP